MIAVVSTKENKKLNINLTKYLESNDLQTWNFWKDTSGLSPKDAYRQYLKDFSVIVFIITKDAINDNFILSLYRQAFEQDKDIILFLESRLDRNLPNWFFLENHDWVNAYEVSFDTAAGALKDLINEYQQSEQKAQKQDIAPNTTLQSNNKKTSGKQSLLIIIGIIIILGIVYLLINPPGNKSTSTKPVFDTRTNQTAEQMLIGTWGMKDYYDDIQRSGQDLIDFKKTVANLKKNFRMTFYPNHTFTRIGFAPQQERGYWKLDEQNHYLIISDIKKTGEDRLKILTLNENQLIFEIATYPTPQKVSVVRITLYKLHNNQ